MCEAGRAARANAQVVCDDSWCFENSRYRGPQGLVESLSSDLGCESSDALLDRTCAADGYSVNGLGPFGVRRCSPYGRRTRCHVSTSIAEMFGPNTMRTRPLEGRRDSHALGSAGGGEQSDVTGEARAPSSGRCSGRLTRVHERPGTGSCLGQRCSVRASLTRCRHIARLLPRHRWVLQQSRDFPQSGSASSTSMDSDENS